MNRHILYAATPYGYAVQLMAGGEVVAEYSCGNHANDSTVTVPPDDPKALNLRTISRFAKQSANELGREKGITQIDYDDDLEQALREEHGE